MDRQRENHLRREFKIILRDLSKSLTLLKEPAERSNYYKKFESLYYSSDGDEFHHFYSDIFIVLTEIKQTDGPGGIELLGENIRYIREHYTPRNRDSNDKLIDISKHLRKLYDHLSLDISRISYSDRQDKEISEEDSVKQLHFDLQKAQDDLKNMKDDLQKSQLKLNEDLKNSQLKLDADLQKSQSNLKQELEKVKVDYVAVLGLFSGIVLTFFGGIVFSTSVLENVHQASAYRLAIIVLLIAALVLNAIFICFWAVDRISHRDKKNLPIKPWIITNVIIGVLIVATLITYFCGCLERRDHKLNLQLQETTASQEIIETQETTESQITIETQDITELQTATNTTEYTKKPAED